jgi:outer membrane protein TolC
MKKQIIYILLLSLPHLLWSQSPRELFEISLEANTALKALKLDYQAALEKGPQVSQLPNPELSIGAFILPVETRLGGQQARLSLSQMFPWFKTLEARESWALSMAQVDFEKIASQELEIYYQIKSRWYQLYLLDESQQIILSNIELLNALKRTAEAKVSSGRASLADVLRVDLKLKALEKEIEILEAQKQKPLASLNQLLQRPIFTAVAIQDSLEFTVIPFQRDTLMAAISGHHPMMRMFRLQQEVSRRAIDLNELEGKPSFGIGADYLMVSPRSDAFPENNGRDIVQLKAVVSMPIYRKKYDAKQREEQLKINAIESRKQEVLSLFLSKIEGTYADHQSALLRKELYEEQIRITKAAIQILLTDYSNQGSNFDELLRLEEELIMYDRKLLEAIVDSHQALAEVERYLPY